MRHLDLWMERRVLPLAMHDSKEAFAPWRTDGATKSEVLWKLEHAVDLALYAYLTVSNA